MTCTTDGGSDSFSTTGDGFIPIPSGVILRRENVLTLWTPNAFRKSTTAWACFFVNSVAEAGKAEYPLPMYVNAQLPAFMERPGDYPSGGPHPYYLAVYRAMAPAIDFYAPDIYWPEFEYWVKRYEIPGNPIFIPEARIDSAPSNALAQTNNPYAHKLRSRALEADMRPKS